MLGIDPIRKSRMSLVMIEYANTDTNNNNDSLTIHSTPQGVFDASNIIFLVINSEPHLKTIFDDILNVNRDDDDDDDDDNNHLLKSLKGKTIVNTVTHDPFAAHDLDEVLNKYKVHHVSALLFGVPDTVCGSMAKILISAPDRTISIIRNNDRNDDVNNDDDNDNDSNIIDNNDWDSVSKVLRHLGTVHNFSDGFNDDKHNNNEDVGGAGGGDVGLASMVYLSLIQSLYFGLAGYELSLLLPSKYLEKQQQQQHSKSSSGNATKDDSIERILIRYQELACIPAFLPIISDTIIQQDWMNSYVPASDAIKMFETHEYVFEKLGLVQDSYHAVYLKYLRRTVAAGGEGCEGAAGNIGISAVVQHYSNDDNGDDQEL